MLLTPLRQVLVLQYLNSPSSIVLNSLVRRHDRSFVVHLLEPVINRCLYGDLCNLGVQYRYDRFWSSSDISNPTELVAILHDESSVGVYVGLLLFTLFIPNSLAGVSIQYFLHTTITLLTALSTGPKHNWYVIYGGCP